MDNRRKMHSNTSRERVRNMNIIPIILFGLGIINYATIQTQTSIVFQTLECPTEPCQEHIQAYFTLDRTTKPNILEVGTTDQNLLIEQSTFKKDGVCDRLECDQNILFEAREIEALIDTDGNLTLERTDQNYYLITPTYRLGDPNSLYKADCYATQWALNQMDSIISTRTSNKMTDACHNTATKAYCCFNTVEVE